MELGGFVVTFVGLGGSVDVKERWSFSMEKRGEWRGRCEGLVEKGAAQSRLVACSEEVES